MPKGQKPKPSMIKELEGNRSKLGRAHLRPDARGIGVPRPPVYLTADQRALWADIVASLPVGLLSRADEQVLERMVVAWSRYRECQIKITASGLLIQSPQGPIRHPLLVTQARADREMHAAGEVLGLSPAARARLSASESPEDDPMALLLGEDGDPDGAWATSPRTRQ